MDKTNIKILDIPFTTLNEDQILKQIQGALASSNSRLFIATPNPEMLLESQKNLKFKNTLQNTNLNIPDGNGIIWANKFLEKVQNYRSRLGVSAYGALSILAFLFQPKNTKIPFNKAIHGSDLMLKICLSPEFQKYKIFLLGNSQAIKPNTSELTAEKLKELNPQINLAGNYDATPDSLDAIHRINKSQAEIVFVAFGAPKQEIWIAENLHNLPKVKIIIGVGGSFDFISGIIPRAPQWLRRIGLEWVYRLIKQPLKRSRRIFNAFLVFPYHIIQSRLNKPTENKSSKD